MPLPARSGWCRWGQASRSTCVPKRIFLRPEIWNDAMLSWTQDWKAQFRIGEENREA
jgi:hypothetical protein